MAVSNLGNGSGIIQAQGIGSGLDIQGLVKQLVAAEAAPVEARLTKQAARIATEVSALGSLKGALSAFQGSVSALKMASNFDVLTATSTDEDLFTATAGSAAVAGSYNIEVTQLAQAEQIVSSNYAGGSATVIGTGTLTVTVGSTAMNLTLTSSNNTLAGIRDAINAASNNPGVQATILSDATGARLVLTGRNTGAANTIRLTTTGGGGMTQLDYPGGNTANWTNNQAAQSASIKIAGVSFTSTSNTVTGVIEGVSLNLKAAAPGSTATLAVASDANAVTANVKKFVDAYNALQLKFTQLTGYNAASKTGGPLQGDPLAVGLSRQLRSLAFSAVSGLSGSYTSLASLGITSDAAGQLSLNSAKLGAALAADRNAASRLFTTATSGIAVRLDAALTTALGSTSTIAARDKGLAADQKTVETQQTEHNRRMTAVQQRYLAQFNALDGLMAKMRSTSSYLSQHLGAANSATGGSSR